MSVTGYGQRVRERRQELGLTQELLSELCGYHPTRISKLENGHENGSIELLFALSRELDISTDALLGRTPTAPEEDVREPVVVPVRKVVKGYRGVYYVRGKNRWRADITITTNVRKYIGIFATAREAALAYDREAIFWHGDDALLNFPDEVAAGGGDYQEGQEGFEKDEEARR